MEATVAQGMEQTLGYMETCRADEGHLVVIDRREQTTRERAERQLPSNEEPAPRHHCEERERDGRRVTVWTL